MKYLITILLLTFTLPAFGQSIKKNADGSAQVFFKDGSSIGVQAKIKTSEIAGRLLVET